MNTQPARAPDFCPFKGLEPYTEDYRDYFFGREPDEKTIISNLHATPLTVLYGTSGVGKSSVLMAGVVPQLRQSERLAVVVFRSWQNDNFIDALKREVLTSVRRAAAKEIRVDLSKPFDQFLDECTNALGGPVLFILDQFEEYFLYHPPSKAADSFDAMLARAVNRRDIDATFLLSMREEELSKLDRFRGRIPNLLSNTLRLNHLDRASAEKAVREPLNEYNRHVDSDRRMTIEDELVSRLLDKATPDQDAFTQMSCPNGDAADGGSQAHVETPVLQMLLTRLWNYERKAGSPVLRLNTFEKELRGAESIMGAHLEEVMGRLTERERETAAEVFRFLVTPSRTKIAQDPRSLASWANLDEGEVEALLARLSSHEDMRLLRVVRAPRQPVRYEIFHDVLAKAITEYVQTQVQLKTAKRAAEEAAKKEKEAASELQLQQARALAEAERLQAEAQTRRAEAERARAEEQERRAEAERLRAEEQQRRVEEQAKATGRLKRLVAMLVVTALLAAGAAVYATMKRSEAQVKQREAIAAQTRAEEETTRANSEFDRAKEALRQAELLAEAATFANNQATHDRDEAIRQTKRAQIAIAQERDARRSAEEQARLLVERDRQAEIERQAVNTLRKPDQLTREAVDLRQTGDLKSAIAKYHEALHAYEQTADRAGEAQASTNIGAIYLGQGKYADAEPFYRRALDIREKTQRPDSPNLASSLNQLALVYYYQGKYAAAEPLFTRAIDIYKSSLGPSHPYVATTLNNLANLYRNQGTPASYAKAELLYEDAIAIRKKVLRPDDPEIATNQAGLARLYSRQGKYEKAAPLFEDVLRTREKVFGPDHPTLALTLSDLATVYRELNRYAEAKPLYERALAIRQRSLPPGHPYIAETLDGLAVLYFKQGKYSEAQPLFKQALDIREKALGPVHPDIAASLNHYAALLRKTNRDDEAISMELRAKGMLDTHAQQNVKKR
ncbi:MAG TPA: tetratricopeptide repeat protein [Blastocatellia bacterium]|nr:tetratricopeptide repeat protein [Blastocatellia bacterium]